MAVFSLEMSRESLVQRMLCAESKVDSSRVRTGRLSPDDFIRLARGRRTSETRPRSGSTTRPALSPIESAREGSAAARGGWRGARRARLPAAHVRWRPGRESTAGDQCHLTRPQGDSEGGRCPRACPLAAVAGSRAARGEPSATLGSARIGRDRAGRGCRPLHLPGGRCTASPRRSRSGGWAGKAELIVGKQRNGPTGSVDLYFPQGVHGLRVRVPADGTRLVPGRGRRRRGGPGSAVRERATQAVRRAGRRPRARLVRGRLHLACGGGTRGSSYSRRNGRRRRPRGFPSGVVAVAGGVARADSVRAGVAALAGEAAVVLVHDGARPFSVGRPDFARGRGGGTGPGRARRPDRRHGEAGGRARACRGDGLAPAAARRADATGVSGGSAGADARRRRRRGVGGGTTRPPR